MRLAILSDIHANRQAFAACLVDARARGTDRFVLLGDYVGYGADPEWAVDTVRDLVGDGAIAILGNHDDAVNNLDSRMSNDAQIAIEWTRTRLDEAQKAFLATLPMMAEENGLLFVHADASEPRGWLYVRSISDAADSIAATTERISFCGHVHRPLLYSMSAAKRMIAFVPTADFSIQLLPGRKWLAVQGAVGQPRDRNAAAAYSIFDTEREVLTYHRVPYDIEAAARRIRDAGLPSWLADRLFIGN